MIHNNIIIVAELIFYIMEISKITISERNIIIGYYEHWDYYNRCRKTDNWRLPLRTRILGKGVFLTKEDAEKALKGGAE